MNQIKLKSWILGALILIGLSLIVDYYFIHILFEEKQQMLRQSEITANISAPPTPGQDNFLTTLQSCLPEIASQGVATPTALIEYFQKSIGTSEESTDSLSQNETTANWTLKDGAKVKVRYLDQKPLEFSYNGHGKELDCILNDCRCR